MPNLPYTIAGIVYSSDGTTVLESVNVQVTNVTTGESHTGSDSGYENLISNSSGEFQVNLGSFTSGYSNADSIEIMGKNANGLDSETTTVNTANAGESTITLVLVPEDINNLWDQIDEVGERSDHRRITTSYETDEGSIEGEGTYTDTTMTISHQIISDERVLLPWGEVKEGEAIGFFKGKENLQKDDLIRIPMTTGQWWRIQNVPVRYRRNGHNATFEARLVRVDNA